MIDTRIIPVPESLAGYTGAKNGPGVYQSIINKIGKIDNFLTGCLGSGSIIRRLHKYPHCKYVGIDIDPEVISAWMEVDRNFDIYRKNVIDLLEDALNDPQKNKFLGFELNAPETLIYLDPPYPFTTRSRKYYSHEFTDSDHVQLIELILSMRASVIISTRANLLYDLHLGGGDGIR